LELKSTSLGVSYFTHIYTQQKTTTLWIRQTLDAIDQKGDFIDKSL